MNEGAPYWTVANTASATDITITRVKVSWTGDSDGDSTVDDITINNTKRNSSSSSSGAWNNISDVAMTAGTSWTSNNWLFWGYGSSSANMNNETETYTLEFEFADASTYTTTGHNPS